MAVRSIGRIYTTKNTVKVGKRRRSRVIVGFISTERPRLIFNSLLPIQAFSNAILRCCAELVRFQPTRWQVKNSHMKISQANWFFAEGGKGDIYSDTPVATPLVRVSCHEIIRIGLYTALCIAWHTNLIRSHRLPYETSWLLRRRKTNRPRKLTIIRINLCDCLTAKKLSKIRNLLSLLYLQNYL